MVMSALPSMPDESKEKNNRKRNTQHPKKNSATHDSLRKKLSFEMNPLRLAWLLAGGPLPLGQKKSPNKIRLLPISFPIAAITRHDLNKTVKKGV